MLCSPPDTTRSLFMGIAISHSNDENRNQEPPIWPAFPSVASVDREH